MIKPNVFLADDLHVTAPEDFTFSTPRFDIARRGYERRHVDDFLREVEGQIRSLLHELRNTTAELVRAESEIAELRRSKNEAVAAAFMEVAQTKDRMLAEAERRAERIVAAAEKEAAAAREFATNFAEERDGLEMQLSSLNEELDRARVELQRVQDAAAAEQESLREARSSAADLVAAAQREVEEARSEARRALETARTETQAARESQQEIEDLRLRAEAEARRVLAEAREQADRIRSTIADDGDAESEFLVEVAATVGEPESEPPLPPQPPPVDRQREEPRLVVSDDALAAVHQIVARVTGEAPERRMVSFEEEEARPTRYSRHSAQLPRIGEDAEDAHRRVQSLRDSDSETDAD